MRKEIINKLLSLLQVGKRPLFITGHARSGTRWVGNTIAQAPEALYYSEPCNPQKSNIENYSIWFQYIYKNKRNSFFENCLDSAFQGLLSCGREWSNQKLCCRLVPGYKVVVKDVASLMSLEWICKNYNPEILILVRHPCAVIISEIRKGTPYQHAIDELLKQTDLIDRHLSLYLPIIRNAKTQLEIFSVIWSVRYKVIANVISEYPDWNVCFYEDICESPIRSFQEIYKCFDLTWNSNIEDFVKENTINNIPGTYSVSRVSKKQVKKWKSELTLSEIQQIYRFFEPFDLPFYNSKSSWI